MQASLCEDACSEGDMAVVTRYSEKGDEVNGIASAATASGVVTSAQMGGKCLHFRWRVRPGISEHLSLQVA